ncbi:MAG: right-handed parallel beta-helix repeat-containing protein [Pseudomonadota bacterium]
MPWTAFIPAALMAALTAFPSLAEAPASTGADRPAIAAAVKSLMQDVSQASDVSAALGLPHVDTSFPPPTVPPFPDGPAAEIADGKLQLGLSQLAIHAGTNGHIAVVQAQKGNDDALFLKSGFTSLTALAQAAQDQGLTGIALDGQTVRLTRPLIVWMGAGLRLAPGDVLEMDSESGAFVLGFGQVAAEGATIAAVNTAGTFRPFLLVAGQGTLVLQDSRIDGLGLNRSDNFGGVSVLTRGLFRPEHPPVVTGNVFTDTGVVFLAGSENAIVADNAFDASRSGGLTLSATTGAQVYRNTVTGSLGAAGLRLRDGAFDTAVVGNTVSGGRTNGIQIEGNSRNVRLAGNTVAGNGAVGIVLRRTACAELTANIVAGNDAVGVKLQQSGLVEIDGNAFLQNGGAGASIEGQPDAQPVALSGNLFSGNREGLAGSDAGQVTLSGDNFGGQLPRLFGGEFAQHLPGYLTARDQLGQTDFALHPDAVTQVAAATLSNPCQDR